MSFSGEVKEELAKHISPARHCQIAELAAILNYCGQYGRDAEGNYTIGFQTENEAARRKGFTLLKKTYNIGIDVSVRQNTYQILAYSSLEAVARALVQNACCKRAFIRGAFLAAGSVSDPGKSYHFEIVCDTQERAALLQEMIGSFQIGAKITTRKNKYVVYVKEGSQIVDLLGVMEAHVALMEFENVRILKEVKNSVNRQVNCETANLGKTVSAAMKQLEDIRFIQKYYGFHRLPETLAEMAEVRLEHPSASLKELGQMLNPPVGKSGVNHRLRKLSILAEELKEFKEEKIL